MSLETFMQATTPRCPIIRTCTPDGLTPDAVVAILKKVSRHCFLLESAAEGNHSRYTFLGYNPAAAYALRGGVMTVSQGADVRVPTSDPFAFLQTILEENAAPRLPGLPPFIGGLVGFFSYESAGYTEPSLRTLWGDEDALPDMDFMLFDKVICFDRAENKLLLIACPRTAYAEEAYYLAQHELESLETLLRKADCAELPPFRLRSDFTPFFTEDAYCAKVETLRHHIREGDIFQAVLANGWEAQSEGSLFAAYKAMRRDNPSPYLFYFSGGTTEIAGAAPETLVKLEDGMLETYPLAGTRPRGKTPEEDAALERELLADEKELAEHHMLIDLGRNDLNRVSKHGSVTVPRKCDVLRFSHVMHIGSTVRGELREDASAPAAVAAVLPAGTLSGAPKLRAMELLYGLEQRRRGLYGGAVGYFDFAGDMDFCIAIRMAIQADGKTIVRAGAGIVADSNPQSEAAECMHKSAAVKAALVNPDALTLDAALSTDNGQTADAPHTYAFYWEGGSYL